MLKENGEKKFLKITPTEFCLSWTLINFLVCKQRWDNMNTLTCSYLSQMLNFTDTYVVDGFNAFGFYSKEKRIMSQTFIK